MNSGRMIPIRHHQPLFTPVLIQTLPTLTWENLEERSRLEGVDPCFLRRADGLSDRSPEESFEEMRDVPTDRTSFLPASEPQPECSQPRVTATIMPNLKATPPMKITYKSLECYLWISSDRIVIAHHDGVPLLVYTASFQVKQAFVYHFGDKKDENSESVCIIGEKKIEIITSKGMFDYALPFEIGKVIPTPLCILIERASETDDFLSNTSSNLFTLTDTLVGVLPAILHKKGYTNEWYYPFDCEEVKVIGAEKDLLIVHDPTLETHLVYLIKKVEPDFWNTAAQVTEKETPISLRRFLLSPSKSLSASRQRSFRTPTTEQRTPGRGTEERGRLDFIQLLKQRRTPSVPDLGRTPVSAVSSFAESSMAGTSTMHQDTAFWPSHYPKIHEIEEYEFGDTLFDDYYGTNICIELLFSEKAVNAASTSAAAKKAFLTTDVIGIEYLALLIPVVDEQCELRLYNLGELRKGRISMEATMCKDASSLAEPGYMIVQDLNSNLQLHSGIKRLCLVALCAEPTRTDIFFQNGTDGFFWRSREYAWICNFSRFPMTFSNSLCKRIWDVLVQTVEPEKAISLISEIRSTLTPLQNVNEEIQRFLYLINRHLGIKLSGDFWDPEFKLAISSPDVPRGGETEAKVPRPRRNLEDIARWALSYDLDPLTKASPTVKYEFLPNAFLSPDVQHILTALHTLYETIQLFKRKPPGFAFFMRNLYALNRALDCVDRAQIYASDDSNLRKIRFVTDNSQAIVKPAENLPLYVPAQIDILMQSRALTALPPNVSKDVAVVLLALATAYERVNLAGDLYQFLGNARKFFKDHPIGKSSLTSANFVSKTSLERLEFLLDEFPTILNFSSLSPMLEFLLKFKLFQLSENSRFLKIKKINFQQPDGIASNEEGRLICRYRWPHDIRLFNVESLLDSSRPTFIPKRNHQNEADAREMSDQFVLTVAIRTMTLAFGIAALQLRSVRLYVNQPFIVPEICFSGRSFPENRPIELTIGDGLRSVRDWGDFYHGVSRGLSIRAADEHLISGEWIQNVFTEQSKPSAMGAQAANNQNVKPSAASAGLLLGLGLNNHLPVLNIYNTHQMLASQDKFTSVALLLGYGASKIGTGDEQVHRILITHISFLMGPTLLDVNIDNSVQASAILSLGLLFAQRGTTTFINRLLNEMGKGPHPDSEPSCERYAYVLSIGMAIGLAGLGRGNRHIPQVPFVEAKPGLIERLLIMMEGGPKSRAVFNTDVWTESAFSEEAQAAPSQSNYCKEINDRINIHVTATIAFGLLFMKTHNKTVEFLLRLPNTMPELEKIRADVVPVRVIARALVNWNEIEPTKKWIMEQVPEVVRTHANNAIGLRWPNRIFDAREDDCCDRIVDRETVAQAYIHCIAAACFAVALKFASTTLTEMKELFMEFILMLTPDENQTPAHARLVRLAEKGAVAVSRNLLISALGILMAGSGDVDVFRLCYYLRRSDPVANWYKNSYTHCIQAAIHTTLGFLFLGNARYCFGQSDLAIASLVIAFYPLVGHHAGDHRLYLQPFRFLWVLAVERRLIYAIDADNSKMCRVPLRIHLKAGTSSQSRWVIETTPCLLPPLSGIVEIVIGGSQFEQKMLSQGQIAEILEKQNGCIPVHKARKHVLRQAALLDEEAHRIDAGELEGVEVWQWTPSNQGHDSSTLDWQKMKECLDQARVEPGAFDSRGILTGPVIDLYQNSFKNERLIEKRDVRMAKTFLRNECNPSMLAHFMQRLVDVAESEKSAADAHEPSSSSQEVQPFSPEDLIFNWRYV